MILDYKDQLEFNPLQVNAGVYIKQNILPGGRGVKIKVSEEGKVGKEKIHNEWS